jgi:hypothetical protein
LLSPIIFYLPRSKAFIGNGTLARHFHERDNGCLTEIACDFRSGNLLGAACAQSDKGEVSSRATALIVLVKGSSLFI